MINPDKYRNFGFRQSFYEHFLQYGIDCFSKGMLGVDQYKGLKGWLADAGMLVKERKVGNKGNVTEKTIEKLTPLAEKLMPLGAYNPFVWAIMWANLAYDSVVAKCFCINVEPGATCDADYLIECLGSEIKEQSRKQATNSLFSTFRDSPIGGALKQGIQIDKAYLRAGWDYPHAVAILYALYLYAEHTGRRSFTYTELVNAHNNPDAAGMSPADIFGIDTKAFRDTLQGLAVEFPKYLRVSFVANLDNIILEDFSSLDILELAEE